MRPLLIVEPHEDSAELMAQLLGYAGIPVRQGQALDKVDGQLDAMRPGLLLLCAGPGDEAKAKDLIEQARQRRIPVVLVSSTRQRSWPGADAVFGKPFEVEALVRKVQDLYQG